MVFNIMNKTYTNLILSETNRPTPILISVQDRFDQPVHVCGQTIFATSDLGGQNTSATSNIGSLGPASTAVSIVGVQGPHIMSIITLYLLLKKSKNTAIYYILCLAINMFINFLIKYIIKQKRPNTCESCFNRIKYKISFFDTFQNDIFGMPSGHA